MSPALYLIKVFGGVRATARAIGRSPSTVSKWKKPRKHGGTGGQIPTVLQNKIMAIAKRDGLPITADDLVNGRR